MEKGKKERPKEVKSYFSPLSRKSKCTGEKFEWRKVQVFLWRKVHKTLSIVYLLFVRIIGFKILLFPIIDSLGNPLRIFTPFSPPNPHPTPQTFSSTTGDHHKSSLFSIGPLHRDEHFNQSKIL